MTTNKLFIIFILLCGIIYTLSCTKNLTDAETFIISGVVTLDGETDNSNIIVSLYAPVELDTAIVNTQKRFPAVGFELNQAAVFDHRQATPVYTTKTDKEGKYSFANLPGGNYNLVASKDDFGWRYLFNINGDAQPENIKLLPEIVVQGKLELYTLWYAYQHVIVRGDVTLPQNGVLIIDKGVVVIFDGYYSIDINGELRTNGDKDNFIVFTGSIMNDKPLTWNGLKFSSVSNSSISYIKLEHSNTGFSFKDSENIQFNNSYLINNKYESFSLTVSENIDFSNNICLKNQKGLFLQNCDNAVVENNIFIDNSEGFENEASSSTIKNNYLANHAIALHVQFRPSPVIQNNQFYKNGKGIFCAGSDPEISKNNFTKNVQAINLGIEYNSTDSQPVVNYNNFLGKDFSIYIDGYPTSTNIKDIDGKNNYWGTVIIEDITRSIWDKYDITTSPVYIGEVFYQPIQNLLVSSAGISKNN